MKGLYPQMSVNKKIVLISGASRGIGRAVALRFAREGYTIGIGCRDMSAGRETARLVKEAGGDPVIFSADLRNRADVECVYQTFKSKVGAPSVLVNCAGVASWELFQLTDESEYDRVMDSNVRSAYLLTKEVLPDMVSNKSGSVIFISSMWGQVGAACEVIYSASKAALIGMTKALAKEVGPSGIRVNCVSPGVIITDMTRSLGEETLSDLASDTPLGRNGEASDVAECVYWLASDAASFITGEVIGVNGGFAIT